MSQFVTGTLLMSAKQSIVKQYYVHKQLYEILPWAQTCLYIIRMTTGLILHGAEATKKVASMPPGHCLGALEMLQIEIKNVLIGCRLPRRK